MLKQRILTASFLIPMVIALIFYLPAKGFSIGAAFILLLAAWEWSRLSGLTQIFSRFLYTGLVLILFIATAVSGLDPKWSLILGSLGWFLLAPFSLLPKVNLPRFSRALLGFVILLLAWQSLIAIRAIAPSYVLLLLLVVWLVDSAAYFIGKQAGRHKLAPQISPNKTWEGAIGGLLAALVFSLVLSYFPSKAFLLHAHPGITALLVFLTALVSIVGDLFESKMKRLAGVKDSGRLVPGHGGVLDRMDSILAAAPIFALGLFLI